MGQSGMDAFPDPHVGDAWWDASDNTIGVVDFVDEYLWYVRICLQCKIEKNTIVDVRVHVEDDTSLLEDGKQEAIARAIADFLKGRNIATSTSFANEIFWCPSMVNRVVYQALLDWASKGEGRSALLPQEPSPPANKERRGFFAWIRRVIGL